MPVLQLPWCREVTIMPISMPIAITVVPIVIKALNALVKRSIPGTANPVANGNLRSTAEKLPTDVRLIPRNNGQSLTTTPTDANGLQLNNYKRPTTGVTTQLLHRLRVTQVEVKAVVIREEKELEETPLVLVPRSPLEQPNALRPMEVAGVARKESQKVSPAAAAVRVRKEVRKTKMHQKEKR